jgi:hypothetical protein
MHSPELFPHVVESSLQEEAYMSTSPERGETQFVIGSIIDKLGEDAVLQELEKNGAVHTGY